MNGIKRSIWMRNNKKLKELRFKEYLQMQQNKEKEENEKYGKDHFAEKEMYLKMKNKSKK